MSDSKIMNNYPEALQKKLDELNIPIPDPADVYKKHTYSPKPGFAWNPYTRYPRNALCPACDSGKKYKKCHLITAAVVIPIAEYAKVVTEFNQRIKDLKDGKIK